MLEKSIKGKIIEDSDKNYLLTLFKSGTDFTDLDLLEKFFAYKKNTPPMFNTNDIFTLPKGFLYNDKDIKTTVGRFVFNVSVLYPVISSKVGYINQTMNKKSLGSFEGKLSKMLLEDKISPKDFIDYLDRLEHVTYGTAKFLNASLTYDLLVPTEEMEQKKKEVIEENIDKIEKGDLITANKMEKELISFAKDKMKDVPSYQIYDSGARGSFDNNFKNTSLLRGPIKNLSQPGKIKISTASLIEGIPPDELEDYADIITQASYFRAIATRQGGYEAKKISASLQTVVLDEDPESDCHTHKTIDVVLTNKNKSDYLYRYIVDKDKLVLLDSDNIDNYVGKLVKMRSPLYCIGDKYCSKCAGLLYYKLGIKNVGIIANRIGTSLLNGALKQFHDMSLNIEVIDIDKFLD